MPTANLVNSYKILKLDIRSDIMENINKTLNLKEIGLRIRDEREKLGLSREKFSELVGLSSYYIGQIERGDRNMSLDTLYKISSSLNIPVDYILKGYIHYMESIMALDTIEENYKEELDEEIKEILLLLSSVPKQNITLIKEMIKLILPNIK